MSTSKNKNKDHSQNPENFIKQNPLIFGKYKPIKLIGKGNFGNVYLGYNTTNKKYVAIKTELRQASRCFLESEAYILFTLKGFGIPELFSYGRSKNYNVLIQTLLGKSLLNLYNERKNRFTLKDVCILGLQILDRIEWVHSKDYIHRDIKPENFLIGKEDPNIIYLIDFGLCKKYRSTKSGKHSLPLSTGRINGTVKYLSVNALKGKVSGRRDDIISIGYMLIIFLLGNLPWGNTLQEISKQQYHEMMYKREKITPEELCFGLPEQFADYFKYSYNLTFDQTPDYDYLRSLFTKVLEMKNFKDNNYIFSWVSKEKINSIKNIKQYRANSRGNRSSSRHRLLEKIESSLKEASLKNSKKTSLSPQQNKELINAFDEFSPPNIIKNKKKISCVSPSQAQNKNNFQLIHTSNICNNQCSLSPQNNNINLLKNTNSPIFDTLKQKTHNSINSNCNISNLNNSGNIVYNINSNKTNLNDTFNKDLNSSIKISLNKRIEHKKHIFYKINNNNNSRNCLSKKNQINNCNYDNSNSIIYNKSFDNVKNNNECNLSRHRSFKSNYVSPLNKYRIVVDQRNSPSDMKVGTSDDESHKLKNKNKNLLNRNIIYNSQKVIVINKKSSNSGLPYKKKLITNKSNILKNNINFITVNTTNNTTNSNITNYNIIPNNRNNLKFFSIKNNQINECSYPSSEIVSFKRKNSTHDNTMNMDIKMNNNTIILNPKLNYIQIPKNKYISKIIGGAQKDKLKKYIRFLDGK